MHKNIPLVIGITILFLGTCITPTVAIDTKKKSSIPISDKSVIIVDDEGDGDYTSLAEALEKVGQGDTIEVYSGVYELGKTDILKHNITLIGIPYELGRGNDTGRPVIDGHGYVVFWINVPYITLKNFIITNKQGENIIYLVDARDCLIADNIITNTWKKGIYCNRADESQIINNSISNVKNGIWIYESESMVISNNVIDNASTYGIYDHISSGQKYSGNIITNCGHGIYLSCGSFDKVSANIITNCKYGIYLFAHGEFSKLLNNHIENNIVGLFLYLPFFNIVMYNNFINNNISVKFTRHLYDRFRCIRNYYSDGSSSLLKKISGELILLDLDFYPLTFSIFIKIPWRNYEWFPAKEPYVI